MKKSLLFFVAVVLVQLHVFAQVTPCDQPGTTAGFAENPACEAAVCEYDSWCCDAMWDSMCAIYSGMFEPCYPCVLGSNKSYLTGQIFVDINCNGIFDTGEYVVANHPVSTNPNVINNYSDANVGFYNAILNNGVSYTVNAAPKNGFTISNSQIIPVPGVTTIIDDVNFGLCPIPGYFDGGVSFVPTNISWILGSVNELTFQVFNNSGWNISGQLTLTFNTTAFQLISTSGLVNGNQITWEVQDLEPFNALILTTTLSSIFSGNHNFSLSFTMDEDTGTDAALGNNIANTNALAYGEFGSDFCDAPQSTSGFSSFPDCEQVVCDADWFCCESMWDAVCAASAAGFAECALCLTVPSSSSIASGYVFFDENCNETLDNGEITIPGVYVHTDGTVSGYSNSSGLYYSVLQNYSTHTLTVIPLPGFNFNTITLNTDSSQIYTEMNIGYCPVSPVSNVGVSISPTGPPPRPGFPASYNICITNFGSTPANATIELDFTNMANCSVLEAGGGTVSGTILEFNSIVLDVFETQCFLVVMQVPVGTPAGTLLFPSVTAYIQPNPLDDADLSNNTHILHQEVVAAYDPNDKTVNFPVVNFNEIPAGQGAELEYLIRFQNTGNFYATFVRVVDELPEFLDINTIHMINASHDYELSFPEPNVLEWFFDEIMLPDSTTDEPGSHGFIHFRIKTNAGVQLDDVIENNALIYFDFKEAVVTDYAVTTFMDCSEGSLEIIIPESICAGEEFVLSPNRDDFNDYQWIVDGDPATGAEITAMLNENSVIQLFANHPVCSLSTTLDVAVIQPPTMYLILGPYVSCTGAMEIETFCSADFSWYLNDNNQGSGDPFIATESGLYNVNCENECGVDNTNIVVEIYDTPETEIVLDENGQLTVNPPGQSYIWYFNGEPILGANAVSYTPTQSGDYSVTVIFSTGCGSTTDVLFVPVSVGEELASKIIIYPNPANQVLNVVLPFGQWKMALIDVTGKVVLETGEVNSDNISIDTKQLVSGVYLLIGFSQSENFTKTILIQQ